jgi:hypothetical protein
VEDRQVDRHVRLAAYGYLLGVIAAAAAGGYLLGGSVVAVVAAAVAALASVTILATLHRLGRL